MFTKTDIEKYFIAEKNESLLFIFIGIAAIILAVVFIVFLKTNFYKGASLPLLLIAFIQIVAGYTVYTKTDKDRVSITYAYDMNPSLLESKELPRMQKVIKNFVLFKWLEITLFVAGVGCIFLFRNEPGRAFWYGLGVTLAIQAALMFGADHIAESRAKLYRNGLQAFTGKA